MSLTEIEFWDEYWHKHRPPIVVRPEFSFDRCLSIRLAEVSLLAPTKTALEVGASPGKWLHFLSENGFKVAGLEISPSAANLLKENLSFLGHQEPKVITGDILHTAPTDKFGLVYSLGLVEHFDDPIEVIRAHLSWLEPGGTLIIGVPNFRGFHGTIQRALDDSVLKIHNLQVMSRGFFESAASQLDVCLESFTYLGSFEPTLPMIKGKAKGLLGGLRQFTIRAILKVLNWVRKSAIWDQWNGPRISSYLLVSFSKPLQG